MFSSFLVAFIVGSIFVLCKKYHLGIKLPDQVPAYIAEQFTALIPVILSTIVFGLISYSFSITSFGSFHQFVYTLIGTPLNALGSNIWGLWILQIIMYGLWFFGIHGGMTIGPVLMTLFYATTIGKFDSVSSRKTVASYVYWRYSQFWY